MTPDVGGPSLDEAFRRARELDASLGEQLRAFADRIKARGKPFKVAITAVMRKLIAIINAVLATRQACHYARAA